MKPDICSWMRPLGYAGVLAMGLMTTSCFYVWQEPIRYGAGGPGQQYAAPAPGTLDELKEKRERQQAGEVKPEPREVLPPARDPDPEPAPAPAPVPTPPRQEVASIPVARKVPGRDGFVFSPYNNKMIDVKGFPKGMKVLDPHFDPSEKKYFRVP